MFNARIFIWIVLTTSLVSSFIFGSPLVDDKSRSIGFNLTGITGLPPYNEWLTDIYELIVKDYVEDVYVDIIETYVIATIKLIGWAGVGAFAVFKQTWAENLEDKKPKHMTYAQNYTKPRYFETDSDSGLFYLEPPQYYYEQGRSFNLRQTTGDHCFCDPRPNCVCDLSAEIGYLMRRAKEMQEFVCFWLELGERIGNMVMAGDVEL